MEWISQVRLGLLELAAGRLRMSCIDFFVDTCMKVTIYAIESLRIWRKVAYFVMGDRSRELHPDAMFGRSTLRERGIQV
jgi:hypothetical protein